MAEAGPTSVPTEAPTPEEVMLIVAARAIPDRGSCFVGVGIPGAAANVARRLHARSCALIYESGPIGAKPKQLPLSIGDGELAETADAVIPLPEVFSYWLQGGLVDLGFLGAAQIDRYANLNSTVIGDYEDPTVRLPGAGGAPDIVASAGEVVVLISHSQRTFVERVDFVTSPGFLEGAGARKRLGFRGKGPQLVVSDLGCLRPDPDSGELTLITVHPGVSPDDVCEQTGWPLAVSDDIRATPAPNEDELGVLRQLRAGARS